MLSMHKSKEELAEWRSTKKVPSKPKPSLVRALLPTKARRLGEISLSQMLQEDRIDLVDIAKGLVIQRPNAGLGQMLNANIAKKWGMLKEFAKADQYRTNHSSKRLRLE